MKKFLMVTALVGMIAAPAFAGLAPESASTSEITPYSINAGPRSAAYVQNDGAHLYDNMTVGATGPQEILYQLRQNVASGGICNLLTLKPGASLISSAHIVIDNRLGVAGPRTMTIQFRNDLGGAAPVGTMLTTASLGFSANYIFPGMPLGAINLMTFNFGAFDANVTQTNIWLCMQANYDFRVRGGDQYGVAAPGLEPNTQVNGGAGDGANGAFYIGSGSGVMASSFGAGLGSASLYSPFTIDSAFAAGNLTRLSSWHVALGGTPEPATAALFGLIGLVALRRRKA